MRTLAATAVRTVPLALLIAALLLLPAPAEGQDDGPGWLYVGLGGDIVAMRPDGSDRRNLTATPDRFEDFPDVYDFSGRDIIAQFQEIGADGTPSRQGGLHYINPITPGNDFDPLFGSFVAATYAPSWGFDTSQIYHSNDGNQIDVLLFFEGRVETPVSSNGGANTYFDPDGNPSQDVREEVLYTFSAGGRLGGLRVRNYGDSPSDLLVAAGRYAQAGYGRYFDQGNQVIFTCRVSDGGPLQLCRSAPDQEGTGFAAIPTPVEPLNAAVSPDNTQVAYRGFDGSLWVSGIDGSNPVQVVSAVGAANGVGLDWGREVPLRGGDPVEEPEPEPEPDPAPNTPLPASGVDGDPSTTDRAAFARPGPLSTAVSAARFADAGTRGGQPQAAYAVLGRDDAFADSLAGSPLTARGPLLFTASDALAEDVAAELQRVLAPGGTVYLLGGEAALSAAVSDAVAGLGLTPRRLAGPSRFETSVAVAREVVALGGSTEDVLVARGNAPADNPTAAWADSVTGGAHAATAFIPVVVTPSDAVHPAVEAFVTETGASATLLGGTAALSAEVEAGLPGATRVAGDSRADTAARIATDLIGLDPDGPRTVLLFDGFSEDGWTFGLAGAGLAADLGGALLMAQAESLPPQTEALLSHCGDTPVVEAIVLGWSGVIADSVLAQVDALDGGACS